MKGKAPLIIGGLVIGGIVVYALTRKAEAAPPEGYVCPYCGATFSTYDELVAHCQSVHAGERIPIDIIWTS